LGIKSANHLLLVLHIDFRVKFDMTIVHEFNL